MKKLLFVAFIGFTLSSGVSLADEKLSAQEIIKKADAGINPKDPFQMTLKLVEFIDGNSRSEVELKIISKLDGKDGQFRNLVRWAEPARDRGKGVLLNGTKMWFYDPASKSSVQISPQQRLVGTASEGDVVTVNFASDYQAKYVGSPEGESVTDADKAKKTCYHLELTPTKESAVYGRAEYWVEKDTFRPVKAKFYTDSGRLLKIAFYHKFEKQLGVDRPSEAIIIDAVNSKLVTTMNSSSYKKMDVPESWFQRDYLPKLKEN
jgi:outer membrane lipoprotein-sorting protein